jgi:glycosyltransferase involved in cell wall biosynthesis
MLVTYRFGEDIPGGAERHLWELMYRLARRGHHVEVFTTRCRQMISSPFGYLLWDNFLPRGTQEDDGLIIHRFDVRNPRPARARRINERIKALQKEEKDADYFVAAVGEGVRGEPEHCFLSGWHEKETWDDGPARWTGRRASLVVGGKALSSIHLEAQALSDTAVKLGISGEEPREFRLDKGEKAALDLSFSRRDGIVLEVESGSVMRPVGDERELGVAVRRVEVEDDGEKRELWLSRGWVEFLETGPEEAIGRALWAASDRRPDQASSWHRYLIGPRSPRLEREVMSAAPGFDVVLGAIVPMATMHLAWKAARQAGKPYVAFPLFHPRDPNHYWGHLKEAMLNAAGVEGNSPAIAELMMQWNFKAFAVGPGFDIGEWSSPDIDGARFRREYDLGDQPLLLWVARKTGYKGYREAIGALAHMRERGCPANLVMIGPDEDFLPVSGEGVYYLGTLPREKVMDAYDACDVFIFPSLHESFCMVFCEAWLREKPVLGNAYCAAARSLIDDGRDGYVCRDAEEYGRRALELIENPAAAREMGRLGREKVLNSREWNKLVLELENILQGVSMPTT